MTDKLDRPIVVVEDSDEDFEALSRAFNRLDVRVPVQRFTDADDCLEYLRGEAHAGNIASRPALILLDLNLPGTDGKEALQEIKSDGDLRAIPVTVVTSSTNKADVETCYRYGANGYMTKGGSFQSFQQAVGTMLDFWFKTVVLP
jgi:CheY-like chemotaxis protein